ncbi:winged helix-turn-helix transcriptional regulator [Shigella flexneri]
MKHVTSRWGVLILVALREGTHRFSDLRRKIGGVSEKMLAQSLQALEQDGFLTVSRIRWCHRMLNKPHAAGRAGERKVAALADWIELSCPRCWRCGMNVRITAGCAAYGV